MTNYGVYKELEKKFGRNHQLAVTIGELGELTNTLSKAIRGSPNDMKIMEEVADVIICIEQLRLFYDEDGNKEALFKKFKLERLRKFYVEGEHK